MTAPQPEPEPTTVSGLLDWTADAIEALQVGDTERALRDLYAIHLRLTTLIPPRRGGDR